MFKSPTFTFEFSWVVPGVAPAIAWAVFLHMVSDLKIKKSLEKSLAKKTEKKYVVVVGLTPAEIGQFFQRTDAHLLEQGPTEPVLCCGS